MAVTTELVDAAAAALARHGFEGATLERIAGEAGLSRVTLYRRGVTREQLLAALADRAIDEYRKALWPALTADGSGADRLAAALDALCDLIEMNLPLVRALDARSNAAVFHEPGEDVMTRGPFAEPLARLLRDGSDDGSLRACDADETATTIFNMVSWTYVHLRAEHGWPADRTKRAVLDVTLNGLVPAPTT